MQKIVFLDRSTIPEHIVIRRPSCSHEWIDYPLTSPKDVIARAIDASIIVTNKVVLNSDILSQLPKLQHIAIIATGYNNIDIKACQTLGIAVTNVRGYGSISVPEHTMALIFALRRHLFAYQYSMQKDEWQSSPHFHHYLQPTLEVNNSQLGIIGSGELGKATAAMAKALGMKTVFADRKYAPASGRAGHLPFDEVICSSDILALFCPLTSDTHNLITLNEMQRMKPNALLINTARGGLVNEADLVTALNNKLIAGAGFDVASQEPINPDNPLLSLLDKPNFILTPHVAWTSDNAMQTQADMMVDNIECFIEGENLCRVV
jgi:glycerate dehydrogenase